LLFFGRLQDLERTQKTLVDTHHSTGIVEFATVVRSAEQSNKLALAKELVAVFDNLMGSADQIHVMLLQETGDDVWSKGEGNTAIIFTPTSNVLVGIRPQQVTEQAAVRNLIGRSENEARSNT
jgi:hypothetical protein